VTGAMLDARVRPGAVGAEGAGASGAITRRTDELR
jgi:hypothetical protein